MGLAVFLRKPLAIVVIISMLLGLAPVSEVRLASIEPPQLSPYLVRVATPDLLVLADRSAQLVAEAQERQKANLGGLLDRLAAAGHAGPYSFDEAQGAFSVALSELGREELSGNPLVAALDPLTGVTQSLISQPSDFVSIQSVSSVSFIQLYSPFVWGRVSVNGLTVQLTLENSTGDVKGVPTQGTASDSIKIDRTQLYYETLFTDPTTHSRVNILPGDRVHVVTSGVDPVTGLTAVDDRRISVEGVQAWTSYEEDRVSGVAPPGSSVIVTVGSSAPSLGRYLTPGTGMTYAEVTAGPGGSFTAPLFRTSADSNPKNVDLDKGSAGFVRVRHSDGNEVYTIHGQNILVLENSPVVHGYAYGIPSAPSGLETGVTVPRPAQSVTVTLKNALGQVKAADTPLGSLTPYLAMLDAGITAGDTVEVSLALNQPQPAQVAVVPLSARIDIASNQINGSGPASSQVVLGVGLVNGYITSSSRADYVINRVTTSNTGAFSSGQIQCGNTNYLSFQPGSFGYAGYEEGHGNFVYMAFAAPTDHIMAGYPFLEGWIADGTIRPSIALQDASLNVKQQATASPLLLYMSQEKLYINTYYQMITSEYIVPGDTVTVVSGSRTSVIPVDKVTAYINTDNDSINGEAPPGVGVRVVPEEDRSSRRELVADAKGVYSAGNPFTSMSNTNCSESTKTKDFDPGDSGRAYVRHADGNQVFASYGRSMHVQENENYVELYPFVGRGLDWWTTPQRTITVTVTPKQGSPASVQAKSAGSEPGKTQVYVTTGAQSQKVLIRVGDSVSVGFDEGPAGLTRPVTLSMNSIALITGTPDVDTDTLAGVGPKGWPGAAKLNQPASIAKPTAIQPSSYTAYAPVSFAAASGSLVPLQQGYSGLVSFSDTSGHRLFTAWAVTAYPVKITGWLIPGGTQVCGKAPPGGTVRIHDVTVEGEDMVIGTGTADAQGNYCVTVNPPLYENQVVMAEADGTFSQPAIVRRIQRTLMPNLTKQQN